MPDDEAGVVEIVEGKDDDANLRVRVPHFPVYSELRHLLPVWCGRPRKQITGLQATVNELRGTVKNPVDWTDPATWISERLDGSDRELAQAVWDQSNGAVNPRHIYGHWLLAQRYGLLRENSDSILEVTESGIEFFKTPGGEVEALVDEAEGLTDLLSIVGDVGPTRAGGLVKEWRDFLIHYSNVRSESMVKDTMRRRLTNLLCRGLVERRGNLYSLTSDGLLYLQRTERKSAVIRGDYNQVRVLVQQNFNKIRDDLRERLQEMEPFAFEHLIKRLLEEMNYQDVEVTSRSNDGGIDVVGEIELGITSVREVVQAKRHRRAIQRKDLDALRGSLYRFNAVRGTIVTTSRFSKGTQDAAFAAGAAPITLVDGEKLVNLLIEHSIGVRKRTIEFLEMDASALTSVEQDG